MALNHVHRYAYRRAYRDAYRHLYACGALAMDRVGRLECAVRWCGEVFAREPSTMRLHVLLRICHGLYSYGLCYHGPYSYGLCSYGLHTLLRTCAQTCVQT